MAAAIRVPCVPHRVDREASATARTVALLGCSNSRVIMGLKLVSDDCAQSIAGLPVAHADEIESETLERARMLAEGEFLHPFQDEQLNLRKL
jgi:hypothetical protein